MKTQQAQAQMEGLATLLVLNDEVRKVANIREFGFFTTNETHRLIPYHMAFLWTKKEYIGVDLLTQSGTAELDKHAISNQWLASKIDEILNSSEANKIHSIDLSKIEKHDNTTYLAFKWGDVFPSNLLWCPFFDKNNIINGGIVFLREIPFSDPETKMIKWLIASYQYTWLTFYKSKHLDLVKKIKRKPFLLLFFAILLFPIHLSVLGTATVAPKDPILINAPIEGVINRFYVQPGQQVQSGQLLFTLDKADLESNVEVSKKELMLTQAKLRTAINQGIDNEEISAEIPILKAQLAIDNARIQYTNELLGKTDVKSPINGIVIFDSKEDWVGQPVHTGERILVVTDPTSTELKIMLPISNIIDLKSGDKGEFFLYGSFESVPVKIRTIGYNAKITPNKVLSYEFIADFENEMKSPQLGSQGTVRLYGRRVPLIYYLIRKPLQNLRQSFGI